MSCSYGPSPGRRGSCLGRPGRAPNQKSPGWRWGPECPLLTVLCPLLLLHDGRPVDTTEGTGAGPLPPAPRSCSPHYFAPKGFHKISKGSVLFCFVFYNLGLNLPENVIFGCFVLRGQNIFISLAWPFFSKRHLDYFSKPNAHCEVCSRSSSGTSAGNGREALNLRIPPRLAETRTRTTSPLDIRARRTSELTGSQHPNPQRRCSFANTVLLARRG